MASTLFPIREPVTVQDGLLNPRWQIYFRDQEQTIASSSANATTPIALTDQDATIGTTAFPSASLAAGLYRASYYARIASADGTSSSLTISFLWTDGAITCSTTFPAITGDSTATTGSGTYLMSIDGGTPVSYSATYASNTPGLMKYNLSLVLEQIGQ